MKFFVLIFVCALIGCSITLTSALTWQQQCWNQGGVDITHPCPGVFMQSECQLKCVYERNTENWKCIDRGCCCLGETEGFPHGDR